MSEDGQGEASHQSDVGVGQVHLKDCNQQVEAAHRSETVTVERVITRQRVDRFDTSQRHVHLVNVGAQGVDEGFARAAVAEDGDRVRYALSESVDGERPAEGDVRAGEVGL